MPVTVAAHVHHDVVGDGARRVVAIVRGHGAPDVLLPCDREAVDRVGVEQRTAVLVGSELRSRRRTPFWADRGTAT